MTEQGATPVNGRNGALAAGRAALALIVWAAAAILCASLGWAGLSVTIALLVGAVVFGIFQVGDPPSPPEHPRPADQPRTDSSPVPATRNKQEST